MKPVWAAQHGSAKIAGTTDWVYVSDDPNGCADQVLQSLLPVADVAADSFAANGPNQSGLSCFARQIRPDGSVCWVSPGAAQGDCHIEHQVPVFFPMMVAGVDPVQENKLVGLDKTMVRGIALTRADTFSAGQFGSTVPVIASTRTYADAFMSVGVTRLSAPAKGVPALLTRTPPADSGAAGGNTVYQNLTRLPRAPVTTLELTPAQLYEQALISFAGGTYVDGYWSAGQVEFRRGTDGVLHPQPRAQQQEVWSTGHSYDPVPPTNADVQYRTLTRRAATPVNGVANSGVSELAVQGQFDPAKLPGFSPLSQVPLEAYSPPIATAADSATAHVLDGQPYRSTLNVGGYLTEPPFLLTTITAVHGLTSPKFFSGANDAAPISVVRVRVAGVTGVDKISIGRIETVAGLIAQKTGLDVDITAGSSPQPQQIALQASPLGTPALLLRENWVAKGVALTIVHAADRKSLLLLGLVLVVSVLFLLNAGAASVRTRRQEFATLLCLGWRPRNLFAMVFSEITAVGVTAGVVGSGLAFAVSHAFGLNQPVWRLLLVIPVSVLLALLAGVGPAWLATRGSPLEAAASPGSRGARRAGTVRGITSLAVVNLRRARGRTALAVAALVIGIGALAALAAVTAAFSGVVDGTLLGNYVAVQVRPVDYVTTGLVLLLAAAAVADLLVLAMRERAVELITLKITGWSDSQLTRLVLSEGLGIGLLGSVLGAAAGAAAGLGIGGDARSVLTAAALAAVVGVALTAIASVPAALAVARLPVGVASAEA